MSREPTFRHMAECESCRAAVERTRRLAGAWRSLEPSSEEIARAMARFRRRSSPRRPKPMWARAIVACALVAATGVSAAAVRVLETRHGGRGARSVVTSFSLAQPPTPRSASKREMGWPEPIPVPSSLAEPSLAAPPTGLHEVAAEPVPRGPRVLPKPDLPSAEPVTAPPPPSPWIVAAEAMRARDYQSAERAFSDLLNNPDAHTRDAARLARAQVWISEGRVSEARSDLETLKIVGVTASIRERATEALQSLLP